MRIRDCLLSVLLGVVTVGCRHTYIDLNPDTSGGDVGVDDGTAGDGADADAAEGVAEVTDGLGGDGTEVVILPAPPCGNGVVDDGEECDDRNRENNDGCTWECRLGDGDPVGPPDPAARPYVVQGPAIVLPVVESPSNTALGSMGLSVMDDGTLVASWNRAEVPLGPPGMIWSRFLLADGSPARADVGISLASGWHLSGRAGTARATDFLLAWQADVDGMWHARLTVGDGLAEAPTRLFVSPDSDLPALAAQSTGYAVAWYEGTDLVPCAHDGSGPSRILLGRLDPDGKLDPTADPIELEAELGARTSPRLASGADSTLGILWWRAGTESDSDCTLRLGTADAALTTIADGGTVGTSRAGRIVEADGSYRVAWRRSSAAGIRQLGFVAFDGGAMLLEAPAACDLPFASFVGEDELGLSAGDHGLVAVLRGYDDVTGPRLYFVRTDLLGRTGDASCGALEVDRSCADAAGCEPGAFGVAWAGDAFVVIYFVTLDPSGPSPTTEMRMVRLVPAP
ncbi:MAG: hypothetical protein HY905_11225 [Deltaproteobacteria bacterium]|nr:hypothetical protein [Deltaproteobacteria bacterium]